MTTLAADLYLLVAAFGLALPVAYAGLPVLGQGAFVAVGAFMTMQLAAHGTPLLLAVAISVAAAAVAGYAVGFAAARLVGAPLALATWGLAWLAYVVLVQFPNVSGGSQGVVRPVPARLVSPSLGLTITLNPGVHVAVAAVLCVLVAVAVRRSESGPWGLDWAALRTGPVLADSLGIPVQRRRRALIAAAAALGALGGAGGAILQGVVAPPDYSPLLSLQLFVAVLVGGVATWWGPVLGVALLAALPTLADHSADLLNVDPVRARAVLTAVLLVAAIALRATITDLVRRLLPLPRRSHPLTRQPVAQSSDRQSTTSSVMATPSVDSLASMRGVVVDYGAVRALDGVDLDVLAGEVHALIGPNGSGKSTALRALAGVIRPTAGVLHIGGAQVPTAGSSAPRVRAGLVRTLQRTATLGDLSASTQVAVGTRARDRVPFLGVRHLVASPMARATAMRRAAEVAEALREVGLDDRADVPASGLDSAQQRLLQIARAASTGAPALLLDEPAAGMSAAQRNSLVVVLRRLAAAGRGVLVVEHDMNVVDRAADRVTVLAGGVPLVSGTPAFVRAHPDVRRAYLGES